MTKQLRRQWMKYFYEHSIYCKNHHMLPTNKTSRKEWIAHMLKYHEDPYLTIEVGWLKQLIRQYHFNKKSYVVDIKFDCLFYCQLDIINEKNVCHILESISQAKQTYIVIDLRTCSGGRIDACIQLLSHFLSGDYLKLHYAHKTIVYSNDAQPKYLPMKMMVWVSKNTISAAEILAYALRAKYKNCVLIGTKTKQKQSGQTTYVDIKSRMSFTFSTFTWTIPGVVKNLNDFINLDNDTNKPFLTDDDYWHETLKYMDYVVM